MPDLAALFAKVESLQETKREIERLAAKYLQRVGYLGGIEDLKVTRSDTGEGEPDYFTFAFKHRTRAGVRGLPASENFRVPVLAVQRALEAED